MRGQQLPEGRYGSRAHRSPRRWLRWASAGVVLVAGLLAAVFAYNNLGSPPIEGKAVTFKVLDDDSIRVTVEVRRDHEQRPAVCVVQAQAASAREVGRREVFIPPGDTLTYRETVVRTSARARAGTVFGCSYEVPPYLPTATRPSG